MEEILRYSSNIGAAKIGMEMGAPLYHSYLVKMGFGQKTGLPVVGESAGILRNPKQWAEVDLATASFGQSFSASALQMAEAYLVIANGGIKRPLKLVKDFDPEANSERVFSAEASSAVLKMLYGVVEEDGTGQRARIPGVSVGGKTGTAQKASSGSYGKGRVSSFIGIAPLEKPRYLVVVMIDEPQKSSYGGVVAAPVFRHVVSRSLVYCGELPDPSTPASAKETAASPAAETASSAQTVALEAEAPKEDKTPPARQLTSCSPINISSQEAGANAVVPNVIGCSVRNAVENFMRLGITPTIKGQGFTVVKQSPEPGASFKDISSAECILWLSEQNL